MKKLSVIWLPVILAIVPIEMAAAQIAPGRSGTSTSYSIVGQQAWNVLSDFGVCYASRNRTSAFELVATRPGSIDEAKVYKKLFRKHSAGCLGLNTTSMRTPFQMVRGSIAEGLYRKSVPVPPELRATSVPRPDQARNFMDVILCYAANNPDPLRAVLQTKVGSEAEHVAVAGVLPQLSSCLPPNAQKAVEMDTTLMRFRFAEALWRMGLAPQESAR